MSSSSETCNTSVQHENTFVEPLAPNLDMIISVCVCVYVCVCLCGRKVGWYVDISFLWHVSHWGGWWCVCVGGMLISMLSTVPCVRANPKAARLPHRTWPQVKK